MAQMGDDDAPADDQSDIERIVQFSIAAASLHALN
jgi:hypothetical protein